MEHKLFIFILLLSGIEYCRVRGIVGRYAQTLLQADSALSWTPLTAVFFRLFEVRSLVEGRFVVQTDMFHFPGNKPRFLCRLFNSLFTILIKQTA
jgi:hypothetical protein